MCWYADETDLLRKDADLSGSLFFELALTEQHHLAKALKLILFCNLQLKLEANHILFYPTVKIGSKPDIKSVQICVFAIANQFNLRSIFYILSYKLPNLILKPVFSFSLNPALALLSLIFISEFLGIGNFIVAVVFTGI